MDVAVRQWGNSQAVRIPIEIIKELNIQRGECLDMHIEGNKIVLEKKVPKQTIEDRIQKFGPIEHYPEFDWGESVGREMW